jgi:hypothetical protein
MYFNGQNNPKRDNGKEQAVCTVTQVFAMCATNKDANQRHDRF